MLGKPMNFKPVGDKAFPLRPSCTITSFPKPVFIVTSTKSLKTPSCCQIILELNLFGGICKNAHEGNAGADHGAHQGRGSATAGDRRPENPKSAADARQ